MGEEKGEVGSMLEKTETKGDLRDRADFSLFTSISWKKKERIVLENYMNVFRERISQIFVTKHRIVFSLVTHSVRLPQMRAGPEKREEIREQIKYQLKRGVIGPAQTE